MKIAVLDDYQRVAPTFADWSRLPADCEVVFFDQPLREEDAREALGDAEVIVAMRERMAFPAELLEALPALRLLVTTGMRNAAIDVAACKSRGIVVSGTRAQGSPAAELAWALLLALHKRIVKEDRALRDGRWQTQLSLSLEGRTLGLVGLGKLGSRMARVGQAFGMEVLAWSPNLTDERASQVGVQRVNKAALFERADAVSLHLVLSERTHGIVDADSIARMPAHAYFINTSRAGLVDEAALFAALHEGRIAGAGLDVYADEPLSPGNPYIALPNTVLSPHIGYATEENYRIYYPDAVEDILAWLQGTPIRLLD
ncbi:D-2-hydroxyacid dehydrogenase family protein [Corticimicrobacter populi]|uniref:Hydroxyacid dehydrogenase n=1 Tax=Corticimicrobacter populi TaxID=2175229 RepID=A0A2V1K582_9BURK|nr:D-2-hydroxyacid dehydrogenase family protein [Corticimicrobacter populi]PWF25393.1 hydroxyacid dehydrogenase [Corticimicrobacter populi]